MRHAQADWRATGAFQVGVACQAGGRYDDAVTAYRKVLRRPGFAEHVPTLHNLAVSQIRAHDAKGALETLTRLDTIIEEGATRPGMLERRWNARYNRALALHYLGDFEQALQVCRELLRELLALPTAHKLEAPTLMLEAGLMLSVADPDGPGAPRTRHVPEEVERCATAIAERPRDADAPSRNDLRDAMSTDERAEQIDAYVTAHYAKDPRSRYNLLCFHARLAGRLATSRDSMREIAREDAKVAFRDRRLAAWASHDPALQLPGLTDDPEWRAIVTPPRNGAF